MTIQNKPIGWILLEGDQKVKTGGYYSGSSSKLYQSEGRALAAAKSSYKTNARAIPVYADLHYPNNELTGAEVLDIPMGNNDADAETIGEYLVKLLETLWDEGEDFSGKRPFGNSGWQYELYHALAHAKVIDAEFDEELQEYDHYDKDAAEVLINRAIAALIE